MQYLSPDQVLTVALVVISAHIFPVWLKFKGGKGVATGLAVVLALNPFIAILGIIVFLVTIFIAKTFSLSSILAVWFLVVAAYFFANNLTFFYLELAILGTWTHRENIRHLINGTEKRIIE